MPQLLGFEISDIGLPAALTTIAGLTKQTGRYLIVTANPEILVEGFFNKKFRQVLQTAQLLLPDGFGLLVLAKFFSKPGFRHGRVTGVDLVKGLVEKANDLNISVFFIGSNINILQSATHNLSKLFNKKLNIIGFAEGPIFNKYDNFPINSKINNELINKIINCKPDILLVGFGSPKQELWLNYYLNKLPVKVGIGVGGTFDYLSGVAQIPPTFFKKNGLEWLWRFVKQPKRVFRIFKAVILFPFLVLLFRNKVPYGTG